MSRCCLVLCLKSHFDMSGVVVVYTGWFNLTYGIPEQTAHMKRLTVVMFVDICN
jgi:hypothetical protein